MSIDYSALVKHFPGDSIYSLEYGWVAIAGVAILGFGHEPLIAHLAEETLRQIPSNQDEQVKAFRKLREGCLKASPLVGFPRSIHGLSVLRSTLKARAPQLSDHLSHDKSLRDPVPLATRQKRGKEFFSKIYAQHTERVLQNLNESSGGDLGEFAINCIYGDLVAETSILSEKETGLLEFVCCMCLNAPGQTKGHMFGSHNLGNTGAEIMGATALVEQVAREVGAQWDNRSMDFLSKPKEKGW